MTAIWQGAEQGRYTIEIHRQGEVYLGRLYRGTPDRSTALVGLALEAGAKPFSMREDTLGSVVARLIAMDIAFVREFDERFQLELGRYLYRETFGRAPWGDLPVESDVEVQVLTDDEHITRLPWVLLARGGDFLCASGWSVSLGRPGAEAGDVELPPSPYLLVVAPEPAGEPATEAAQHVGELERQWSDADSYFGRGKHLQVVSTWEDLLKALRAQKVDLLYFYGHGRGTLASSRLLFPGRGGAAEVPVADLAQALRESGQDRLLLAYVNCCQGDAGGLLGAGWQLSEVAPAVVTNRTIASARAAQAQAKELWEAVLIKGEAPHRAVAGLYGRLGNLGLTFRDARWMTPVLHRRYRAWRSAPPRPRRRTERDPHWRVTLDRLKQAGQVFLETSHMLHQRRPRALAYFWYGEEGQGIELFHERLRVELLRSPAEISFHPVRPRWPEELRDPFGSFEDMMIEAFEVQSLDDLAGRIRTSARPNPRRSSLVYVCHQPLRKGEAVGPAHMREYLEWWDKVFAARLEDAGAYGLLGVSFITGNAAKLQQILTDCFDELDLNRMAFHVLDEMEKVAQRDLEHFLHTHGVPLPSGRRRAILQDILKQTGGRYEMTLEALKDLLDRPWDVASGGKPRRTADSAGDDW